MKLRLVAHCLLLLMPACRAANLVEVYNDALRFDSQIREAESSYWAAREAAPQAWAALLPQISGTYTLSRQKQTQDTIYPFVGTDGTPVTFPYDVHEHISSHGYELHLQQTLFSWPALATLSEAHKKVAQAEADYRAAQQSLIERTATAYLSVLGSVETLQAQVAALGAVSRQLDQSRKKFDHSNGTSTTRRPSLA